MQEASHTLPLELHQPRSARCGQICHRVDAVLRQLVLQLVPHTCRHTWCAAGGSNADANIEGFGSLLNS